MFFGNLKIFNDDGYFLSSEGGNLHVKNSGSQK